MARNTYTDTLCPRCVVYVLGQSGIHSDYWKMGNSYWRPCHVVKSNHGGFNQGTKKLEYALSAHGTTVELPARMLLARLLAARMLAARVLATFRNIRWRGLRTLILIRHLGLDNVSWLLASFHFLRALSTMESGSIQSS